MSPPSKANEVQVGGSHYKEFKIQPWDIIEQFGLQFLDGNAVKYLLRWRHKYHDPQYKLEDLKKARHYIDKLIEVYEAHLKEEEAFKRGG